MDNDKNNGFRFTPLQSEAGRELLQRCGRRPDDISSIVLVEEGRCAVKSEAILRIAQSLDAPWSQLGSAGEACTQCLGCLVHHSEAAVRMGCT